MRRVTLDVIEYQEREMRRLEGELRRARHAAKVHLRREREWERAWSRACEDAERVERARQLALGEIVAVAKEVGALSGESLEAKLRAAKLLPAETVPQKRVVVGGSNDSDGEA